MLTGCHWLREGNGKKKGRNGQIPLGMEEQRAWNGLTTIHFYLREGYFGSALSECEKRLIESNEPHLAILRGLTLVFLGGPLLLFHFFICHYCLLSIR